MDEKPSEVGGRDYSQQQNAAPAGVPQNVLSKAKGAITSKIPTSTEDLTKLASQKIMGEFAETSTGKAVTSLAEDAKDVARVWAGDLSGLIPLIKKHYKLITVLLLIPGILVVASGAVIGNSLSHIGDSATSVVTASNSILTDGYCAGMQPTLDWKTKSGVTEHLTVFATDGQFSREEPYDVEKAKSGISLDSYKNTTDPTSGSFFPEAWKPYYASGRWGYVSSSFRAHFQTKESWPGLSDISPFAGRKIIFYNPTNGKAAVAIAMDWGPKPSVLHDRTAENIKKQEDLWNGPGSRNGFRIDNPPGDVDSLVGGGPKTLGDEIGADEYTHVKMGFATDQTLDPTKPFTCNVTSRSATSNSFSSVVGGIQNGKGFKVCLDPGHDSKNGGAEGNGLSETQENWNIASELQQKLTANGYIVTMTKPSAGQPVLNPARAEICNNAQADIAIHIHVDASATEKPNSQTGFTIYQPDHLKGKMTQQIIDTSDHYASIFESGFKTSIGGQISDNGIKGDSKTAHGGLDVSNGSLIPTLLVEGFFIDNSTDAAWYKGTGKEALVNAFLAGISAVKGKHG